MPAHRILIVDDDEKLLKSFERVLGRRFETVAVGNADEALGAIAGPGGFSVVISDYKMPGMNGLEFLAQARVAAPDMARILLTGYADLEMALRAVNESDVFRLLTKPCDPKVLAQALVDAIRYHEAMVAEHEMMEKTLRASVGILADMISLLKPDVFSRVSRLVPTVASLARRLGQGGNWEIETATLLSMVGFITLPESIIDKVQGGKELNPLEMGLFEDHPSFGAEFIAKVPRMEGVSRIVAYQEKSFDGSGEPKDDVKGEAIPLGARILKVVSDYDILIGTGKAKGDALTVMLKKKGVYDPAVLDALTDFIGDEARYCVRKYYLHGLEPGMVLADNVYGHREGKKTKILARGQMLSDMVIEYLLRYSKRSKVEEPITVLEALTCSL